MNNLSSTTTYFRNILSHSHGELDQYEETSSWLKVTVIALGAFATLVTVYFAVASIVFYRRQSFSLRNADIYKEFSVAVIAGHSLKVKLLLEKGLDLDNTPSSAIHSKTPFHITSAVNGHSEILNILLDTEKFDINEVDCHGRSALYYAACNCYNSIVQLLLERGANPNIAVQEVDMEMDVGDTPLHAASMRGFHDIVKLLINQKNIDINKRDNNGQTALWIAVHKGYKSIAQLLLEAGANPNIANHEYLVYHNGTSLVYNDHPLHRAAQEGNSDIIELLLAEKRIDIDRVDQLGRTALFWAANNGHASSVHILLERGANPLISEKNEGLTPLHVASIKGYCSIVGNFITSMRSFKLVGIETRRAQLELVPPHYGLTDS